MPYKLEKSGNKYFVIDDTGKRYSDKPLPKWQATRQMRALWASETKEHGFRVFKQADGSYRWVTISSSAFRDRDGEIVSAKALAEDVERCDVTKSYGPLRWWHIGGFDAPDGVERWDTWKAMPGVDLGTCDFNMLHGKMLIESGTFRDTITGEAFSEAQDNLEVSIAFAHPIDEPGKDKVYKNIHRFERSLLPAGTASNLLTKFSILKGGTMKAQEKLAALVAILRGKPDLAQQILADAEGVQKAAEEAGLEYKEVEVLLVPETGEPVAELPEPAVEPLIAEVPVTEAIVEKAVAPAEEPEVDEIGDMTREDLAKFVGDIVRQAIAAQVDVAAKKQAGDEQLVTDALSALKLLAERTQAIENNLNQAQRSLLELTDARPVGIKQMQAQRPTERVDNVIKSAPVGPTMDESFVKFSQGGK